jgi:DNA helicase-2/ATP-dependent DNA helicase PcrA
VPDHLMLDLGPQQDRSDEVDLLAERYDVRQAAKRNNYTGKTYNSTDNIQQYFGDRGMQFNTGKKPASPPNPNKTPPQPPPAPFSRPAQSKPVAAPSPVRKTARAGMTVEHPKYGTGTVVRREGEGEDAKITVNFPRFGLKKLVEKYAGLKRN